MAGVITFVVASTVSAQVTFEDLRTGYHENQTRFWENGKRIVYRYQSIRHREGSEIPKKNNIARIQALIDQGKLNAEELALAKSKMEGFSQRSVENTTNQNFTADLFADRFGAGMRVIEFRGDRPSDGPPMALLAKSSQTTAFDESLVEHVVNGIYWSAVDDRICHESTLAGVKSFGEGKGKIDRGFLPWFAGSSSLKDTVAEAMSPNIPIEMPNHTAGSSPLTPIGALIYDWDCPAGFETRSVKMLDDEKAEILIRLNWHPMHSGMSKTQTVKAIIDVSKGCLPTRIEFGSAYRIDEDGEELVLSDLGQFQFADCEIAEHEGIYYTSKLMWIGFGVVTPVEARKEFLHAGTWFKYLHNERKHGRLQEEKYPSWQKSLEVISVKDWSSDSGKEFRPECPPGVRYSNTVTEETPKK